MQIAESEKSYNVFVENLEVKLAYDVDRTLMMASKFMDPEELKATNTNGESETYKIIKQ